MKYAHKGFLAQIDHIEINVCAEKFRYSQQAMRHVQFYIFESEKGKELRSICKLLLKHFRGLKTITTKACELKMRPRGFKLPSPLETHPMGDYETAGDALKLILDGNKKGEKGFEPLGVRRFWWY
ncbi:hypothetical protein ONS96_005402 [Cadophora gregata f. sp. sojae]|nr:hypothetical protein ONS96_005402 [Cadophora gregata f. sp. sojae]